MTWINVGARPMDRYENVAVFHMCVLAGCGSGAEGLLRAVERGAVLVRQTVIEQDAFNFQ